MMKGSARWLDSCLTDLGLDLPIFGGLSYSQKEAIVVNMGDPIIPKEVSFDGIGLEYKIVKYRLQQELITFRPFEAECYEFKWDLIEQRLISHEEKKYDFLSFDVEASPDMKWDEIIQELNSDHGFTAIEHISVVNDEVPEVLQV